MKNYQHLHEKAILLRQKGKSLGEICQQLSLSKGTVYYWIKHLKLSFPTTHKKRACARAAGMVNKKKHATLRQDAYQEGEKEYSLLMAQPTFRDFVVLYLTEGYRRTRHTVSICNSNPQIIKLAYHWINLLKNPDRPITFPLQCHVDNDEDDIKLFWSNTLGICSSDIKVSRKSNSGAFSGRQWRSVNGVLTVRVCDTYFRARLEAWMTLLQQEWQGVSSIGV